MEENLKQRLVGAFVLLVLAIIFLPLVLDGRDKEYTGDVYQAPSEPVIHISHKGSDEVEKRLVVAKKQLQEDREYIESLDEEALKLGEAGPDKANSGETLALAQSNINIAKQQVAKEIAVTKAIKQTPVNSKMPLAKAWTIQIAAFSSLKNAKALKLKLIEKSYTAYIDTDKSGQKAPKKSSLYRVFVGPELRKNRARAIQQAIKKEFNLAGLIKFYQP